MNAKAQTGDTANPTTNATSAKLHQLDVAVLTQGALRIESHHNPTGTLSTESIAECQACLILVATKQTKTS